MGRNFYTTWTFLNVRYRTSPWLSMNGNWFWTARISQASFSQSQPCPTLAELLQCSIDSPSRVRPLLFPCSSLYFGYIAKAIFTWNHSLFHPLHFSIFIQTAEVVKIIFDSNFPFVFVSIPYCAFNRGWKHDRKMRAGVQNHDSPILGCL